MVNDILYNVQRKPRDEAKCTRSKHNTTKNSPKKTCEISGAKLFSKNTDHNLWGLLVGFWNKLEVKRNCIVVQ